MEFHMFCFFIPKIILKIPLKNLGLFTSTTFIIAPPDNLKLTPPTRNTEYYYPYRKNGNQALRRAKTAYQQTACKGQSYRTLITIKPSSHFVSSLPCLQYQYIEKTKKCYSYLFFAALQGLKSFNSSNKATYESYLLRSIIPSFSASLTAQPFSHVCVQEVKRHSPAYSLRSRKL